MGIGSGIIQIIKRLRKRTVGKLRYASNSGYNIQKEVHNRLLKGEKLSAKALLKTNNKQQEELLETVCDLANKRETGKLPEPSDIEKVRSFLADNLSGMTTEFLDRIEQVALMSGLYILAYTVREKNEELVLNCWETDTSQIIKNVSGRNRHFITKLFWCYINRGDDEAVKALLGHPDIQRNHDILKHVRGLFTSFKLIETDSGADKQKTVHAQFTSFIKDKRIAVLGPSASGFDHNAEIERDFDIIIRTSYRGAGYLPEGQQKLLPQISYYGDIDWDNFLAGNDENFRHLSDLKFVVLSRGEQEQKLKEYGLTNVRVATHMRNNFLFLGKHNMIQTILHDLSGYEPTVVKVFYSNLFLSKNLYDKEYAKPGTGVKIQGTREENLTFRRVGVKHNPICNYNYTRQLYKRGLIEADTRLAEILELGTEEYIKQFEQQENNKESGIRN